MVYRFIIQINIILYVIIVIVAVRISRFVGIWVLMEVSLLLSLCIIYFKAVKLAAVIEYFIYQSRSSLIILIGWLRSIPIIFTIFVIIKLGLFPFQAYIIKVSGELVGGLFLLVLFMQKIIPLYLISIYGLTGYNSEFVLFISLVVRVGLGCIGGLTVIEFGGIMGYSSLVYRSWLVTVLYIDNGLFIFYLIIYGLIISLIWVCWGSLRENLDKSWVIVLISGFPPLLGFVVKIKLLIIGSLVYIRLFYIIILISAFSFIYYLRLAMYHYLSSRVELRFFNRRFICLLIFILRLLGLRVI